MLHKYPRARFGHYYTKDQGNIFNHPPSPMSLLSPPSLLPQLEEEAEKCKLYQDVITVLLRCARNQTFHLAQFNASISHFADHLAVLYAFIADAHSNETVQVCERNKLPLKLPLK